jgi:hypothetical protein
LPAAASDDILQRPDELRARRTQLGEMVPGKPLKNAPSWDGETHQHLAVVLWRALPAHQAAPRHPIHHLDSAVVAQEQPLGQASDGHALPAGDSTQRQQQLMLLRLEANGSRSGFAKVQETPELVAEFRQGLLPAGACGLVHGRFHYIVIRYVILICRIGRFQEPGWRS